MSHYSLINEAIRITNLNRLLAGEELLSVEEIINNNYITDHYNITYDQLKEIAGKWCSYDH